MGGFKSVGKRQALRVARQTTVIIHHMHVCSVQRAEGRQRRPNATATTAAAGSKIVQGDQRAQRLCAEQLTAALLRR